MRLLVKAPINTQLSSRNAILLPSKKDPAKMRWQNPDKGNKDDQTPAIKPTPRSTYSERTLIKVLSKMRIGIGRENKVFRGKLYTHKIFGHTFPYKPALESSGGRYLGRGSAWYFRAADKTQLAGKIILAIGKQLATVGPLEPESGGTKKSVRMVIDLTKGFHSWACLMAVNLPLNLEREIRTIQSEIPLPVLFDKNGIEDHLHITIAYGLKDEDYPRVVPIVDDCLDNTIPVFSGDIIHFDNKKENWTVACLAISSPELERLNERISNEIGLNGGYQAEGGRYRPHLTIAYLGFGKRLKAIVTPSVWFIEDVRFARTDGISVMATDSSHWR